MNRTADGAPLNNDMVFQFLCSKKKDRERKPSNQKIDSNRKNQSLNNLTNAFVAISTFSSSTPFEWSNIHFMINILDSGIIWTAKNRKMVINACFYSGLLSYCPFIVAFRKILTVNDIKRKPISMIKMTFFRYRCPSNPQQTKWKKKTLLKIAFKSNQKCSINVTRHHSPDQRWLRYLWYARLLYLSFLWNENWSIICR